MKNKFEEAQKTVKVNLGGKVGIIPVVNVMKHTQGYSVNHTSILYRDDNDLICKAMVPFAPGEIDRRIEKAVDRLSEIVTVIASQPEQKKAHEPIRPYSKVCPNRKLKR
jgi:hypothetical protein